MSDEKLHTEVEALLRNGFFSISLRDRIDELCEKHGSQRAAAAVLKIDHAYLSRLRRGSKVEPSQHVLKKLGLQRVVLYRAVKP